MSKVDPLYSSHLYRLLFEAFPAYRSLRGLLDVRQLAPDLGFSYVTLYRALREGVMTPQFAEKLVEHSENRVNLSDLAPYITIERFRFQKKAA